MAWVQKSLLKMFAFTLIIVATIIVDSGLLLAQDDAEANYNKKCAVCHAKDGSGNTAKGKNLHVKDVHQTMKESEAAMIKVVTDGKGEMDSYKDQFTPDQIKALVEYYRSLGK